MLKKAITYTDFDGVQHTEEFYFNLSKPELAEMAFSVHGGLDAYLTKIVQDKDGSAILSTFNQIIAKSIGRRSADGRRFEKNDEITRDFLETAAYEELFMELVTNADAAVEFVRGIVPADMVADLDKSDKEYTQRELLDMDDAQFEQIAGNDPKKMTHDHLIVAMARRNSRQAA